VCQFVSGAVVQDTVFYVTNQNGLAQFALGWSTANTIIPPAAVYGAYYGCQLDYPTAN
jgi:hypothetical protein